MKRTLGLGISRSTIRAVLVEDGVVEWATEEIVEPVGGAEGALRVLLAQAPLEGRARTPVRAALGPWLAQVKTLGSLPEHFDARTLDRLVAENPGTFFIKNGVPLVTTGVRKRGDDQHAAALHAPLVEMLKRASRDGGVRLEGIIPSSEALLSATTASRATWSDGELSVDVERDARGAPNVTTMYRREVESVTPTPVPGLARIGDRAPDFADAFGAAMVPLEDALVYYPTGRGGRRGAPSGRGLRWRPVIALGLLAVALSAPFGFFVRATRAESQLASVRGDSWDRIISTRAQLAQVTAQLERLYTFGSRPTMTALLADLALGLPDGAAITHLTTLEGKATIEVVASNAAEIVFALESMPTVESVRFDGAIERLQIGNRSMERATILFDLVRDQRPGIG